LVLAICVQSLPVEPKFRQMSLQAEESQTNSEIQAISARIAFLQKLNKLTYDTTLFTRKLRWLLRRSLSEKPTVAEVVELMNKELELSQAQAAVAVEGVADELKLEVKQGIIALKAGLAFIEDNYKAGSEPEADAIISKIKANISSLEARFGKKPSPETPPEPPVEASTAEPPVEEPPAEQSTTEVPPVEQPTAESPPVEAPTAEAPPVEASTAAEVPPTESTGGGSLIGTETASAEPGSETTQAPVEAPPVEAPTAEAPVEAPTAEAPPVEAPTAEAPIVTVEGTGIHNATNDTSSTGEESLAESPLSATAPATFF